MKSAAPTSTPTPSTFTLDYHSKQFFDPAEWEGAVEARFFLDSDGLRGREFVGRIATLCSIEPVIVMQEVGGQGSSGERATLVKRPPYPLLNRDMSVSMRPQHWAQWLGLIKEARTDGCLLPILPNLSANYGLIRLHFDAKSGFGVQVWSRGHGYLFDLRDLESAEKGNRYYVDLPEFAGIKGWLALGAMNAANFHAGVEALMRDEEGPLRQTLRFYRQSDDERALEVFGCNYAALQRTLTGLHFLLQVALGPGGEFADCKRAVWHPWHSNGDEAIALNSNEQWWVDMPAPAEMARWKERICAATGCRLQLKWRPEDRGVDNHVVDARTVGLEWAKEFHVSSGAVNGHEGMEAVIGLHEIVEGRNA